MSCNRHGQAPPPRACCRGQKRRPAQAHLGPSRPGAHGRAYRSACDAWRPSQRRHCRFALTAGNCGTLPPGHAPSTLEPNAATAQARRGPPPPPSPPGLCPVGSLAAARRREDGEDEEACGLRRVTGKGDVGSFQRTLQKNICNIESSLFVRQLRLYKLTQCQDFVFF
jgi:hypothetical protein